MRDLTIVAELGASHGGDRERAHRIMRDALDAGADAFKVQCWSPGTMCLADHVLTSGTWRGENLRSLYERAFLPWEWIEELFIDARAYGVVPFASVFDVPALNFLEGINCPMYKIASGEVVDLALVSAVAQTGKPIIMSTGAATFDELRWAVDAARKGGARTITLLHCVSDYPSDPIDANLATMRDLRDDFMVECGVSDHSLGIGVAVAAVTLGASMVEKHITVEEDMVGLDRGFAVGPRMFTEMCIAARDARSAIGHRGRYVTEPCQWRRSLWIKRDARAGDRVTADSVVTARPDLGLPCSFFQFDTREYSFARDVKAGTPLTGRDLVPV